jgi:hypothetical protein
MREHRGSVVRFDRGLGRDGVAAHLDGDHRSVADDDEVGLDPAVVLAATDKHRKRSE